MCSHVAKIVQGLKGRVPKRSLFCQWNLGFLFVSSFVFAHGST
jgi:hypothetical protein